MARAIRAVGCGRPFPCSPTAARPSSSRRTRMDKVTSSAVMDPPRMPWFFVWTRSPRFRPSIAPRRAAARPDAPRKTPRRRGRPAGSFVHEPRNRERLLDQVTPSAAIGAAFTDRPPNWSGQSPTTSRPSTRPPSRSDGTSRPTTSWHPSSASASGPSKPQRSPYHKGTN